MGGLLAKMMAQDSGTRLWRLVSDRPFEELAGDRMTATLPPALSSSPALRSAAWSSSPPRTAGAASTGPAERSAPARPRPRAAPGGLRRLMARNGPGFFNERFHEGLPTSIDELAVGLAGPRGPVGAGAGPGGRGPFRHRRPAQPAPGRRGDGVVPYDSATSTGWRPSCSCPSGHLCQAHPAVIREVRRILAEHAVPRRSAAPPLGACLDHSRPPGFASVA